MTTTGDLIVPLNPVANQSIQVWLGGQNCKIVVRETTHGVFLSLTVNDILLKSGVIGRNNVWLIYLNSFIGDLYFLDTQGFDNPRSNEFGSRFLLIWGKIRKTLPLPIITVMPAPPPAPTYAVTVDKTVMRTTDDPDFLLGQDTATFTLTTANTTDATYDWRIDGTATDMNFCPQVVSGTLTTVSNIAQFTMTAASSYDFPAVSVTFTVIISKDAVDLATSAIVTNWSGYGCGS
jgi:hypothetical protein